MQWTADQFHSDLIPGLSLEVFSGHKNTESIKMVLFL
jgi:hypothetical protein